MLPEPFKMLLQLLGCNSKVGVWGACRLATVLALFELALPRARETYAALVEARHCMLLQVRDWETLDLHYLPILHMVQAKPEHPIGSQHG
jgi:hypothetical protein